MDIEIKEADIIVTKMKGKRLVMVFMTEDDKNVTVYLDKEQAREVRRGIKYALEYKKGKK